MNASSYQQVTLLPWTLDRSTKLKFRLSAYLSDGTLLEEFRLVRDWGRSDDLPWVPAPGAEHWPGEHVYGGILFHHYGHFLLETLSRVGSFRPGVPIVWHTLSPHPKQPRPLAVWQQAVFELLGVDTKSFKFVRGQPVRVEHLSIAPAGYVIQHKARPEHMRRLACFPAASVVPGRRVWLSRARLADMKRKVDGEAELEQCLAAAGWEIYCPELHPIAQQLQTLTSAEVIAGFMGSAFHSLILAQGVRTRVLLVTKGGEGNGNYNTIARAMGLDQTIVRAKLETYTDSLPRTQFRLLDVRGLFESLEQAATAPPARANL